MKIGSVGCGNVGLNTLRALRKRGHAVFGVDPDDQARARLEAEFGPASVLESPADMSGLDLVFICVPTDPTEATGAADLDIIESVVEQFAALEAHRWWRPPVLVQRSTCPPGTATRLSGRLRSTPFAVNPSFLAKSTQWRDSDKPSRIAYAGPVEARLVLARLYAGFPGSPIFESERYEAVELLKYLENSIDAVLISLWNEYLCLVDAMGLPREDLVAAASALASRDRFATTVRAPGGAFAMHCLPKDLHALVSLCATSGARHHVLAGALRTNVEVARDLGTNGLPTSELIEVVGSRVVLTAAARRLIGVEDAAAPDELVG